MVKGPYATTDSNGTYTINNVPPGNYTVTAWQEDYGTQTAKSDSGRGWSQEPPTLPSRRSRVEFRLVIESSTATESPQRNLRRFCKSPGFLAKRRNDMAKIFAVTIILIAIGSAIPIVMHTWDMPQDISTHGP